MTNVCDCGIITVFSGNSPGKNGLHDGQGIMTAQDSDLIHQLVINTSVIQITEYYTQFMLGNFDQVMLSLTPEVFSKLSYALFQLQSSNMNKTQMNSNKYVDYRFILKNIVTSFETLMQSVYKYIELGVTQKKLDIASVKANILEDLKLLDEYIINLKKNSQMSILPDVIVAAPMFTLKEEYAIYVQFYGFPIGGIFDANLLGAIIQSINSR